MKYLLLLCLPFLCFHGDDIATFTITKNNNQIEITANIDASDIEKALKTNANKIKKTTLESYLAKHLEFKINNELVSFELKTFKTENTHFILNYFLDKKIKHITEIQIKNTLLFEVNEKQANVIQLRFDGMFRDFLINKQKPVLTIKL